jgi:hypothetical protein
VLTDACWALSYLSDGSNDKIQAVIEAGVARRLVELLMHTSYSVQTPALRTIGNVVTGDDVQTQVVLQVSALPCLLALLGSARKGIRKEACWTISNITAGNKGQVRERVFVVFSNRLSIQIQAVIDCSIVQPLIQLLSSAEWDIRKEAAWAISNATSGGTPDQLRYLLSQNCIPPLCELLVCADVRIIVVALEALENLLKAREFSCPLCFSHRCNRWVCRTRKSTAPTASPTLSKTPEDSTRLRDCRWAVCCFLLFFLTRCRCIPTTRCTTRSSRCHYCLFSFFLSYQRVRYWKRISTRQRKSRLRPWRRPTRAGPLRLAGRRRPAPEALRDRGPLRDRARPAPPLPSERVNEKKKKTSL